MGVFKVEYFCKDGTVSDFKLDTPIIDVLLIVVKNYILDMVGLVVSGVQGPRTKKDSYVKSANNRD